MSDLTKLEMSVLVEFNKDTDIINKPEKLKKVSSSIGTTPDRFIKIIKELRDKHVTFDRDQSAGGDTLVQNLILFIQRWKLFALNFFIVAILSSLLALSLPKTFRSHATIIPPSPTQGLGMLQSMTNFQIPGLNLFGGGDSETGTLLAILESRSLMESTIDSLNLIEVYDSKNMEEAVRTLSSSTYFEENEEGTISISADAGTEWLSDDFEDDEARHLSQDIVSVFIHRLDEINTKLKTEKARFQRQLIEKRYRQNIQEMREAEEKLKKFQQKYGVMAIDEQTKAAIQAAAELKAQLIASEVELEVKSTLLEDSNPEVISVRHQVDELKTQLNEMKKGEIDSTRLFPQFSNVPKLGTQYLRLKREVELQNELYKFLTQQYEQAKIQEARDTPTIQVLDTASFPIKKYKPKRMIMVAFYSFMSIVFTALYILVKPTLLSLYRTNQTD